MKEKEVVIIEQTSKRWKLVILIGALMTIGSCSFFLTFTPSLGSDRSNISLVVFIVGVCTMIVGKIGKWWYHS